MITVERPLFRAWRTSAKVVIYGAMLAAACGSQGSGAAPAVAGPVSFVAPVLHGPPVSEGEFVGALASALCDVEKCCSKSGFPYARAACETFQQQDIRGRFHAGEAGFAYDDKRGGDCVAVARAMAGACRQLYVGSDPCDLVYVPTKATGASCTTPEECKGFEEARGYCDSGTCYFAERGKVGEACRATCRPGNYGDTCEQGASIQGVACYLADGLDCHGNVCEALAPPGSPCDKGCGLFQNCDKGRNVCVPLASAGQECSQSTACAGAFYCKEDCSNTGLICPPGTCMARRQIGDACTNNECIGSCVDGVCANSDVDSVVDAARCAGTAPPAP